MRVLVVDESPERAEILREGLRRAGYEVTASLSSPVALLKTMEQLRLNAQSMIQRGERPTEEMEKELDGLLGQVQARSVYQRLVSAQENFDKTMAKVNDWIVDGIEKGAQSSIITLG